MKFTVKNNRRQRHIDAIEVTSRVSAAARSRVTGMQLTRRPPTMATSTEFTRNDQGLAIPGAGQTKTEIKSRRRSAPYGQRATKPDRHRAARSQAAVPEVSGTVVDVFTSTPIEGATVTIQDSATPPHTYPTGTDKSGVLQVHRGAGQADRGRARSRSRWRRRACSRSRVTKQAIAGPAADGRCVLDGRPR